MSKIKTKRLTLRLPNIDDAKFHALGLGNYEVAKNLLVPHPYNIEMAEEWLNQDFLNKNINNIRFVIELNNKTSIGGIGFNESEGVAVLSYWIIKEYWAQRYASEAARAIIDYYFENSKNEYILSGAFNFNKASLKIQQNLGFKIIAQTNRFCPARNKQVKNIETRLNKKTYLGKNSK